MSKRDNERKVIQRAEQAREQREIKIAAQSIYSSRLMTEQYERDAKFIPSNTPPRIVCHCCAKGPLDSVAIYKNKKQDKFYCAQHAL